MKKRLIALVLVLALALTVVFAACGPTEEDIKAQIDAALADYVTEADLNSALENKQTADQVNALIAAAVAGLISAEDAAAQIAAAIKTVTHGVIAENAYAVPSDWYTKQHLVKDETVWGFGFAHGSTLIGFSSITTDENGVITEIVLDEVFVMSSWTTLTEAGATALGTDNVFVYNGKNYIKYIKVGDQYYTAARMSFTKAADFAGTPVATAAVEVLDAEGTSVSYFPIKKPVGGSDTDLSTWEIDGTNSIFGLIVKESSKGNNDRGVALVEFARATMRNNELENTTGFDSTGLQAIQKNPTTAAVPVLKAGKDTVVGGLKYAAAGTSTSNGSDNQPLKNGSGYGRSASYPQTIEGTYARLIDFVKTWGIDYDVYADANQNGYNTIGNAHWTITMKDGAGVKSVITTGATAADVRHYLEIIQIAGAQLDDPYYDLELVQATATGENTHNAATNVTLTVIFDVETDTIEGILFTPDYTDGKDVGNRPAALLAWKGGWTNIGDGTGSGSADATTAAQAVINEKDTAWYKMIEAMLGANAKDIAEATVGTSSIPNWNAAIGAASGDAGFIVTITGATQTQRGFVNAVIKACQAYAGGYATEYNPAP